MKHHNLEKFAGGKLSAQINKALEDVTANVQDPNTDAKKVRKITVTIAFKPNDNRDYVATAVETKTILAPVLGAVTALYMGKNIETGEVECVEMGNQIPGQMSLETLEEDDTEGYDPSTGEIYDAAPHDNVIDLRRAK